MDTTAPFPHVERHFLDALDGLVPERSPDPKDTEREIWMKAGERRLVKLLKRIADEQMEAALARQTQVATAR